MVRHLLFSMFMLLSVFGLMVDGTNDDLTNRTGMNVLGQGIIMAHQTGLLGTAQRIMLWDVYWSFFDNAWIPGGFTGEDVIVHRQLARFIAPFFPLPELRDDNETPMPWEGGGRKLQVKAAKEDWKLTEAPKENYYYLINIYWPGEGEVELRYENVPAQYSGLARDLYDGFDSRRGESYVFTTLESLDDGWNNDGTNEWIGEVVAPLPDQLIPKYIESNSGGRRKKKTRRKKRRKKRKKKRKKTLRK